MKSSEKSDDLSDYALLSTTLMQPLVLFLGGAVKDNADFFEGDEAAADHFIEAGKNLLNSFVGFDDLEDELPE